MILGFNEDVKYKGKTFHIQTEDSGPEPPVINTHVFLGGSILASRRLDYSDAVGRDDLTDHVRSLMRTQHKAVYKALMGGEFDDMARRGSKPRRDIPLARDKRRTTGGRRPVDLAPPPGITPIPGAMPAIARPTPPPLPVEVMDSADVVPDESVNEAAESIQRTIAMPALVLPGLPGGGESLDTRLEQVLSELLKEAPPVQPSAPRSVDDAPLPVDLSELQGARPVPFPNEFASARRLDEVTLAYLAEDIDKP